MTKKINWTIIIIILIITAFLIGYGKNLVSLNKTDKCEGKTLQNKEVTEILPLGEAQALVLLEVYSDYQCPFCGRYYVETIKPMIKDYVDVGKVKLLYKDIAFEGNKSQWAAEAVRCANDQGKFWAYHDKITTVRYQTNNTQIYNKTNLIKTAQELGLDECEFTLCLESGKYTELVKNDTQEAWNKINGTPTSFLNNKMVANDKGENLGAMSYEILKAEIEKILSSKN
ncbi:MAG: thioredoxin domain-containing protein [Candidatus Paceibacterota bacterium]|jgi:protein-disulfide isomerase